MSQWAAISQPPASDPSSDEDQINDYLQMSDTSVLLQPSRKRRDSGNSPSDARKAKSRRIDSPSPYLGKPASFTALHAPLSSPSKGASGPRSKISVSPSTNRTQPRSTYGILTGVSSGRAVHKGVSSGSAKSKRPVDGEDDEVLVISDTPSLPDFDSFSAPKRTAVASSSKRPIPFDRKPKISAHRSSTGGMHPIAKADPKNNRRFTIGGDSRDNEIVLSSDDENPLPAAQPPSKSSIPPSKSGHFVMIDEDEEIEMFDPGDQTPPPALASIKKALSEKRVSGPDSEYNTGKPSSSARPSLHQAFGVASRPAPRIPPSPLPPPAARDLPVLATPITVSSPTRPRPASKLTSPMTSLGIGGPAQPEGASSAGPTRHLTPPAQSRYSIARTPMATFKRPETPRSVKEITQEMASQGKGSAAYSLAADRTVKPVPLPSPQSVHSRIDPTPSVSLSAAVLSAKTPPRPVKTLEQQMITLDIDSNPRSPPPARGSERGNGLGPKPGKSRPISPDRQAPAKLPLFHADSPPPYVAIEESVSKVNRQPSASSPKAKAAVIESDGENASTDTSSPAALSADERRAESALKKARVQNALLGSRSSKTSPSKMPVGLQVARKSAFRAVAKAINIPESSANHKDVQSMKPTSSSAGASSAGGPTATVVSTTTTTSTVKTTVTERKTTKTIAFPSPLGDAKSLLPETTLSSRSSTPAQVQQAPSSQKEVVSRTEKVVSSRRESTIEERSVASSSGRNEKIEYSKSTPRQKVKSARAVVTSLRERALEMGLPWVNPFHDLERPAMPLQTGLQDMMNRLPPAYANDPHKRILFQSEIKEQSRGEASIEIINDIDDEPCPPFEFMWTNLMLYGEGVPRMDLDVKGCNCIGPCDPNSKQCACVVRQEFYAGELGDGFAYNEVGAMHQYSHVPVFECNDACGCTEDCQNRVVQKGRQFKLVIKKTRYKGWGVFAGEDISLGHFIGVYSGELLTDAVANKRGLVYNQLGRTYLFNLDFKHLRDQLFHDSVSSGPPEKPWEIKYAVDAFHAGNHTRFLNHSCDPNVELYPVYTVDADNEKPLLCAFTRKFVRRGEELCFSYHNDDEDDGPSSPKKPRTSKKVYDSENEALVRGHCRCGAANCKGYMFNYEPDDDEEDEDGDDEEESDADPQ